MEKILKRWLTATICLVAIFFTGLLGPLIVSLLLYITTDITIYDCVMCPAFWFFSVIGWMITAIYFAQDSEESYK